MRLSVWLLVLLLVACAPVAPVETTMIAPADWPVIPLAADPVALAAVTDYPATRDAFNDLATAGRIVPLAPPARVAVLQTVDGAAQVRVLDGDHADQVGWVPAAWLP